MKVRKVAAAAVSGVLLIALVPEAANADETITSAGPLTRITITSELNCAVSHTGDSAGEWFGSTACGTLVAAGSHLYGPASIPAGGGATGAPGYVAYTAGTQHQSGTGTNSDPFVVTSTATLGSSGLTLTEVDSYVIGRESYQTDVTVQNTTGSAISAIVYRGGDCFLQNSDVGLGDVQNGNAPICKALPDSVNPHRIEGMFPLTTGSRYLEDVYSTVWAAIGSRNPLPNTCRCADQIDNGLALSWSVSIPAHGTNRTSSLTIFSPLGTAPLTFSKTADASTADPGARDGYTISVSNSGNQPQTLQSITDTLPGGFSYVAGSSSGATTQDPNVHHHALTWTGPFVVPGASGGHAGQLTLHFRVKVADADGTYFNDVTGAGDGVTVVPADHVAPITIGAASSSPSSTPSSSASSSPTSPTPSDSSTLAQTGASVTGQWQLALVLLIVGGLALAAGQIRLRRGRHH